MLPIPVSDTAVTSQDGSSLEFVTATEGRECNIQDARGGCGNAAYPQVKKRHTPLQPDPVPKGSAMPRPFKSEEEATVNPKPVSYDEPEIISVNKVIVKRPKHFDVCIGIYFIALEWADLLAHKFW